jgi:MFS transporter, DHA1 family, multidrug resistance protein
MNETQPRSRKQNFLLIVTLGFLNTLTPFSIDMYLPSFPDIARDLNIEGSRMALTVSIYFIGYALGQLFYGPLLDRFGRKPPIYFGLILYVLATVGCMRSQSIEALLIFRFLSATGGCAASVGATAMVRDFFPPSSASKIYSMLMLVLSVSPLFAPSVGSFVMTFGGWRIVFAILGAVGLLNISLVAFVLPHGQPPDHSVELKLRAILKQFKLILLNRQFFTYTFAGALSFAGLFVYVAGSPMIFMNHFHLNPKTYGAIFALLAVGMIGGSQLNHLFASRFSSRSIFRCALTIQFVLSFIFFAGALFDIYNLPFTIAFLFFILLSTGVTSPNGAALALEPFSKNVGSAAALLGFTQLGIGSLTSSAVGLVQTDGSLPMAATMAVSALLAVVILITTPQ